jgi:hypothetical protein
MCVRRGPERALIDVYIPTLLLLPDSFHWMIIGHLDFNETAIIPIAGFLIARSWRDWRWSFTDLLILTYVVLSIISEYRNNGFDNARNLMLQSTCNSILPYVVAKGILPYENLYADIAKRIVTCLTIVAIISVYEFRMGQNPFDMVLTPLFPGQMSAIWISRYGFLRPAGPYSHAILLGIVIAIAYRLNRWLNWGGYWKENLPFAPIGKVRFSHLWLIAGSAMTLSRGPWLGAAVGAVVVALGRARNRKRAITTCALGFVFLGLPLFQAGKSYVWVERDQAATQMEESAAYRHELLERYIEIVEERPLWGWGRNNFPVVDGMSSIDNHYLLLALNYGEYALAAFVSILFWMMVRLLVFSATHHGSTFPGSIALAFLGIYVVIVISISTVWLGLQTVPLLFLISGWSEALILAPSLKPGAVTRPVAPSGKFKFERVMA